MNQEVQDFFDAVHRLVGMSKGEVREMTVKEINDYYLVDFGPGVPHTIETILPQMGCQNGGLWDAGVRMLPDERSIAIVGMPVEGHDYPMEDGIEVVVTPTLFWGINNMDKGECFIVKLKEEETQITPEDFDWSYITFIEKYLNQATEALEEFHHSAYHTRLQDDCAPHDKIGEHMSAVENFIENAERELASLRDFQPTDKPKTNNSVQ